MSLCFFLPSRALCGSEALTIHAGLEGAAGTVAAGAIAGRMFVDDRLRRHRRLNRSPKMTPGERCDVALEPMR